MIKCHNFFKHYLSIVMLKKEEVVFIFTTIGTNTVNMLQLVPFQKTTKLVFETL